jgi:hypothetical protein
MSTLLFNDNFVVEDFSSSVLYYFDICMGNRNKDLYCKQE